MNYIAQHVTSLRQEITDLRNLNTVYSRHAEHSSIEQTAADVRESRLVQIKQELAKMLNRPEAPAVWWENCRKPHPTA